MVWIWSARCSDIAGRICVGGDLPPGEVDCLQSGLDLLHRLIAGKGAQCRHKILVLQQGPELFRAIFGKGMANGE
jgi:hypothetical protein